MLAKKDSEVLVVGAGPVGLFAALLLAKRGIRVQIADRDWRTGAHSYALALHGRSLELLAEAGLAEDVLKRAYRVRSVGLYDGPDRKAEIRLAPQGDDSSALAVMRQDGLERLLEVALMRQGVNVLWNHEVTRLTPQTDGVLAAIDKLEKDSVGYAAAHTEWVVTRSMTVETPLVIGADGYRSAVRRAAGIDFPEAGTAQHFAVFEFETDMDLAGQMRVVLGEATTDVVWPLPDGLCRWSFQLLDFTAPEGTRTKDRIAVELGRRQFPALGEQSLRALLAERAPWFTGNIGEIRWRIAVRFERRLAGSFGSGRVWLAGDAGHVTSPVGMQSMNVGLREAAELAAAMAGILREGQSPDCLETYGRGRQVEWRRLLGQEGGPEPAAGTDPWIARRRERILPCIPASGEVLAELAAQLGLGVP